MTMTIIPTYGKIPNTKPRGRRSAPDFYQEKIDGSQISFGLTYDGETVLVQSRSGDCSANVQFLKGVSTARDLKPLLRPGVVYRGEYVGKRKQNELTYDRTPAGGIILFDCYDPVLGRYMTPIELGHEAARIGLEVVPWSLNPMSMDAESCLGGVKIEGYVGKWLGRKLDFDVPEGQDAKDSSSGGMMKFISAAFKETRSVKHARHDKSVPSDPIHAIGSSMATPARYRKALRKLKDAGSIQGSLKDLGLIVREVQSDVVLEETERIKDLLFAHFRKQILSAAVSEAYDWYTGVLADGEEEAPEEEVAS